MPARDPDLREAGLLEQLREFGDLRAALAVVVLERNNLGRQTRLRLRRDRRDLRLECSSVLLLALLVRLDRLGLALGPSLALLNDFLESMGAVAALDCLLRDLELRLGREALERLGVRRRELARLDRLLDRCRRLEQAEVVRHRRRMQPQLAGKVGLRSTGRDDGLHGARSIQRQQVSPVEILDELLDRELVGRIRAVGDDRRDPLEAGLARGQQATLAPDDDPPAALGPDLDRLQDAVLGDRGRELVDRLDVDPNVGPDVDLVDGQLEDDRAEVLARSSRNVREREGAHAGTAVSWPARAAISASTYARSR